MAKAAAIRQRIFTGGNPKLNQELGNLARDASNAFDASTLFKIVEFDAVYVEPLPIGYTHEPKGCFCLRVRSIDAPETPLLCGTAVHYVWIEQAKRLNATSIDGLSPGVGNCRFTFLMVG